jgi:hypothetical protein
MKNVPQRSSGCGRQFLPGGLGWAWLGLVCLLSLGLPRLTSAQTSIANNNLAQNGGFDTGSNLWTATANGVYFYYDGAENILSYGWTDGSAFA